MKYTKPLLLLFAFVFTVIGGANAKGIKFGKVSKDEFSLKECSYEKDAPAIVLARTCTIDLSYNVITYSYHVRVKILKEEGIGQANIKLSYYRKDNIENISRVKGQTINLDELGKKEIIKVENSSIFDVDVDENYGEVRFTLPDVKVGSIIEYKYTTNSHFYSYLDTWYFQEEIPTLYSALKVNMPETFRYNLVMFGNRLKAKYIESMNSEWILTDMPSIKEEAYVNNYHDFVEQLRFQLSGYYKRDKSNISGSPVFVTSMTTYDQLAKEYIERIEFLGRKGFARKQLERILDGSENNWEKIEKIYDFVRTTVKWNGKYRLYPERSAPKVIEEKEGTNSEINYLLVLLLREAELECNPALTRSNTRGQIQKTYPLLSQFDQILACVELFGKRIFLNATSPYRPYDLIAEKDLNYLAFVLKKGKPYWAKIVPNKKNLQDILITYDYSDLKHPIYKVGLVETGYLAAESREKVSDIGVENWMNDMFNLEECNFQVDSVQLRNEKNVNISLQMECDFNLDNGLDLDTDFIYVDLFKAEDLKNPFLKETRQYRIDYNYPRSKSYLVRFILPEGYQFEDYPKGKNIILNQKDAEFKLFSRILGNELSIRTSFSINTVTLQKEYYENMRNFYSEMIKAMGSQVVIKKIEK